MRRNDAEQIGDMIRKFFRQNGLESPLNEYRLVQAWKDVVGPVITRYTSNLYIKNQILYVLMIIPKIMKAIVNCLAPRITSPSVLIHDFIY